MKFYSATALDLLVFTNTHTVIDGILVLLVLPDQNLIRSLDWLQYSFSPKLLVAGHRQELVGPLFLEHRTPQPSIVVPKFLLHPFDAPYLLIVLLPIAYRYQ